jgi:spermidine synthase
MMVVMKKVRSPVGGIAPADTTEPTPLLELSNPFSVGAGRLCLLEPADASMASVAELRTRVLDGSYTKPFILDDGSTLSLHFGLAYVQSSMYLDDPIGLRLRYTQKMMGFRLFLPQPGRITLIGLGGGSLAKYCHDRLPHADITAVEIDPNVAAFRQHFKVPPDSERFRVLVADGFDYLADAPSSSIDVLLVDAYDGKGVSGAIARAEFLQLAFRRLSTHGLLVMNLAGDPERFELLVDEADRLFEDRVLVIPVGRDGNYVLYAFKDADYPSDWKALRKSARRLSAGSSVDYFFIAQLLELAATKNRIPWRR